MNHYRRACDGYHSVEQDVTWSEFLSELLNSPCGIVISNSELFAAGEVIGDEVHVHELAGDIREALSNIPDECSWIIYERRDGRVRRVSVDAMKRLLPV